MALFNFPNYTLEYLRDGIVIYENFSFWFDFLILGFILGYIFGWGSEKAGIGKNEKQQRFFGNFIGWTIAFFVVGGIHRSGHNFFELYPTFLLILFTLLGIFLWRTFESFFGRKYRIAAILLSALISLFFFAWALSPLGLEGHCQEPVQGLVQGIMSLLSILFMFVGFGGILWWLLTLSQKVRGSSAPDLTPASNAREKTYADISSSLKNLNNDFSEVDKSLNNFGSAASKTSSFLGEAKNFLKNLNFNLSQMGAALNQHGELDPSLKTHLTNWAEQTQNLNKKAQEHLGSVDSSLEKTKSSIQEANEGITDFSSKQKDLSKQLTQLSTALQSLYNYISSAKDETLMTKYKLLWNEASNLSEQLKSLTALDAEIKDIQSQVRTVDLVHEKDLLNRFSNEFLDSLDKTTSALQKTERELTKKASVVNKNIGLTQTAMQAGSSKIDEINYFFSETAKLLNSVESALSKIRERVKTSQQVITDFDDKFKKVIKAAEDLENETISSMKTVAKTTKNTANITDQISVQQKTLNDTFKSLTNLITEFSSRAQTKKWLDQSKDSKVSDLSTFMNKLSDETNKLGVGSAFAKQVTSELRSSLKNLKGNEEFKTAIIELRDLEASLIKFLRSFDSKVSAVQELFKKYLGAKAVQWKNAISPSLNDLSKEALKLKTFSDKLDKLKKIIKK